MGVARSLLTAWRVQVEEGFGPNSSPLEHVAGVYILGSTSFILCENWGKCDNFQLLSIGSVCLVSSSWY
jgi:hypothetical protein